MSFLSPPPASVRKRDTKRLVNNVTYLSINGYLFFSAGSFFFFLIVIEKVHHAARAGNHPTKRKLAASISLALLHNSLNHILNHGLCVKRFLTRKNPVK